jgi:xylulokinase
VEGDAVGTELGQPVDRLDRVDRRAVDALVRVGVRPRRVLLVGGGARSAAVQQVVAQLLGVPVLVPEPGEYVALGAARQAAWVLTGKLPDWPLRASVHDAVGSGERVRAAFRAAQERVHG